MEWFNTFSATANGCTVTVVISFPSDADMKQLLGMALKGVLQWDFKTWMWCSKIQANNNGLFPLGKITTMSFKKMIGLSSRVIFILTGKLCQSVLAVVCVLQ